MVDVIFVSCESKITVCTPKVCTPPRYATIPILICVRVIPVFLEYDEDVSVLPLNAVYVLYLFSGQYDDDVWALLLNLIRWTYPLNCIVLESP